MSNSDHQEFRDDCIAILREQTEGKRVHRRRFPERRERAFDLGLAVERGHQYDDIG